jgi:hypothetical protein
VCQAEGGPSTIEILRQGAVLATTAVEPSPDWQQVAVENGTSDSAVQTVDSANIVRLHHWSGSGGLEIEKVRMLDSAGVEQVVFPFGGAMFVEIVIKATESGTFPLRPLLTIYRRSDGIKVTQMIGEITELSLSAGDRSLAQLRMQPLNLGSDTYVFSIGLFRKLDLSQVEPPERYDLTERSFEFRIFGREPQYTSVFQHPGEWLIFPPNTNSIGINRIA